MDDRLIMFLSVISLLVVYWVLFGERSFKEKMKNEAVRRTDSS